MIIDQHWFKVPIFTSWANEEILAALPEIHCAGHNACLKSIRSNTSEDERVVKEVEEEMGGRGLGRPPPPPSSGGSKQVEPEPLCLHHHHQESVYFNPHKRIMGNI